MSESVLAYAAIALFGVFVSGVSQVLLKKSALKTHEGPLGEYLNPLVVFALCPLCGVHPALDACVQGHTALDGARSRRHGLHLRHRVRRPHLPRAPQPSQGARPSRSSSAASSSTRPASREPNAQLRPQVLHHTLALLEALRAGRSRCHHPRGADRHGAHPRPRRVLACSRSCSSS